MFVLGYCLIKVLVILKGLGSLDFSTARLLLAPQVPSWWCPRAVSSRESFVPEHFKETVGLFFALPQLMRFFRLIFFSTLLCHPQEGNFVKPTLPFTSRFHFLFPSRLVKLNKKVETMKAERQCNRQLRQIKSFVWNLSFLSSADHPFARFPRRGELIQRNCSVKMTIRLSSFHFPLGGGFPKLLDCSVRSYLTMRPYGKIWKFNLILIIRNLRFTLS